MTSTTFFCSSDNRIARLSLSFVTANAHKSCYEFVSRKERSCSNPAAAFFFFRKGAGSQLQNFCVRLFTRRRGSLEKRKIHEYFCTTGRVGVRELELGQTIAEKNPPFSETASELSFATQHGRRVARALQKSVQEGRATLFLNLTGSISKFYTLNIFLKGTPGYKNKLILIDSQ